MLAITSSLPNRGKSCGRNVLSMLDAKPPIARPVPLGDALEDIELHPDRPIADRVHDHLQTLAVGRRRPVFQIFRGIHQAGRGPPACPETDR